MGYQRVTGGTSIVTSGMIVMVAVNERTTWLSVIATEPPILAIFSPRTWTPPKKLPKKPLGENPKVMDPLTPTSRSVELWALCAVV